MTLLSPLF
jgi:hypothetical protein